jgi:uncharacterized membrane protein
MISIDILSRILILVKFIGDDEFLKLLRKFEKELSNVNLHHETIAGLMAILTARRITIASTKKHQLLYFALLNIVEDILGKDFDTIKNLDDINASIKSIIMLVSDTIIETIDDTLAALYDNNNYTLWDNAVQLLFQYIKKLS